MKEDLQTGPIIYERDSSQEKRVDASNAEIRDYVLSMIDQLSKLADDHGEIVIGAMLAEVARRNKA